MINRRLTGMKRRLIPAAMVLALPFAMQAQAQESNLSFGVTVASEYVSPGVQHSDGIAVQPYVELGFGGLYAGAYVSNLDPDLTAADFEYGLSFGYRGKAGVLTHDTSIAYYLFDEAFDDFPVEDYAEASLSGTIAATETLYVTASAAVEPEFDHTNLSQTVDYDTAVEGLAVGATYGRLQAKNGAWNYWSAGATYQASETIALGLAYHDLDVDPVTGLLNTDGLVVATVSFDFSLC